MRWWDHEEAARQSHLKFTFRIFLISINIFICPEKTMLDRWRSNISRLTAKLWLYSCVSYYCHISYDVLLTRLNTPDLKKSLENLRNYISRLRTSLIKKVAWRKHRMRARSLALEYTKTSHERKPVLSCPEKSRSFLILQGLSPLVAKWAIHTSAVTYFASRYVGYES